MPEEFESTKHICKIPPGAPTGGGGQGKKCLLTIAIDKYDESKGFSVLEYPVANAAALAAELEKSYGFKVVALNDQECTAEKIRDKIIDVRDEIGKDGQLVVFFTGHGAVVSSSGYWIPFDSKEKIEKNCSVLAMLELLIGECAQVLLLVDCCFSGTASDAMYPFALFKKDDLQKSVFSVITAGNKFEVVPDKSVFFEALLEILRYHTISSFTDLVVQLKVELDQRRAKTNFTHHSTVDHFGEEFLLQRKDRISYELAKSFLDLNYKDQSRELSGAAVFNMTYLRGSRECGHNIFLHRYFGKVDKSIFSILSYPHRKISFGGEGEPGNYSMWKQMARILDVPAHEPSVIIQSLLKVLKRNNFLLTVMIREGCIEGEMEAALKDFWEKIFKYANNSIEALKEYKKRAYFFIWDMRGKADSISDIVTKEKFSSLLYSKHAKLLALPVIKEVEDPDLWDWHNDALRKYDALPNDEKFQNLDFTKVQDPRTVMNVIAQIEDLCDSKDAFSKLFSSNKFSNND